MKDKIMQLEDRLDLLKLENIYLQSSINNEMNPESTKNILRRKKL